MGSRLSRMPGGVLVPSRLTWATLDADLSSYTETGPRPNTAEPAEDGTVYRVQVSGGQGEALEAVAVRSGYPGSMAVAYRLAAEVENTDYRGWNPPVWWDAHAIIQMSSTVPWRRHDAVTLPDSQEVVIVRRNGSTGALGARVVSPTTLEAGAVGASITPAGSWQHPAACVIPDEWATGGGRLLVLYDGMVYQSADAGATWSTYSRHPITEDTTNYGRARMAYRDGQVLLLVEDTATADTVHQLVSYDEGATFELVASIASLGNTLQVATTSRGFHVAFRRNDGVGDHHIRHRWIRDAGSSLEDADEVDAQTYTGDAGQDAIGLAAEPDGTLWLFGAADTGDNVFASVSDDGGDTWTLANGYVHDDGSAGSAHKLRHLSATFAAGRCIIAHSWQDGDPTYDGGLGVLAAGGWSNWTSGPPTGGPGWDYWDRLGSAGYTDIAGVAQISGQTLIPVVLPENAGVAWTRSGAAPTLGTGYWPLSTSSSQQWHLLAIGTGAAEWQAEIIVDSGGSSGTLQCGFRLHVADGTDDWRAEICLTTTEIQVRDGHGAVALATVSAPDVDLTQHVQFQAELTEEGSLTVGWRYRGETKWNFLVEATTITSDTAAPAANGTLAWGHIATGTAESRWRWIAHARYNATYQPRLYTGPGNLYGRTMTGDATPIPDTPDDDGRVPWLRASAGPARLGEVLSLPVVHDRGAQRLFPTISPSPNAPWRSSDTSEQLFVFDLGARSWLGSAVGLYLGQTNVRTATLEYSDDGVTWAVAGTLDLTTGFSGLTCTRTGDTVHFGGGGSASRYLWEGELEGGTAILDGTAYRRIAWSTAGAWSPTATVWPEIRLEGMDGSEPASGTLTLSAPSGLLVVYPSSQQRRRYWAVRIPSQTTPEGYFEAGIMLAGRVQPWGAEVDLTRSDVWTPNISESRNTWGTSRIRELGPLARTWRFSWNDGFHRGVLRDGLDLDFHGASGGLPLVAGEDVADALAALMRELRSGQIPVAVAESLPDADATITDPTRLLYGRLRGPIIANGFAGDPMSVREFLRTEAITLEELV